MSRSYNILSKQPKTLSEVRAYVLAWQHPIFERYELEIDGEVWVVQSGFRRATYSHAVLKSERNGDLAYDVREGDVLTLENFPNMGRYPNHNALMEGVVEKYAKMWNITE